MHCNHMCYIAHDMNIISDLLVEGSDGELLDSEHLEGASRGGDAGGGGGEEAAGELRGEGKEGEV